jgi:uncharacterized protein (TIGR03083 family)
VDKRAVAAAVDHERQTLANLIAGLSADEWATPSLCAEWTVRDVVAHLTLSGIGPLRVTGELIRYGGSLSRTSRETARRRAAATPKPALVELLRGMVGNRRHPIGTNYVDPLADVLVHGQDIAVPLGIERAMPVESAVVSAERVATKGYWFWARRRLRGLRLEAADADWAHGDGAIVRGPIAVLLMVLTGRRARLDELSGVGVDVLSGART